jgi:hypothetical protein
VPFASAARKLETTGGAGSAINYAVPLASPPSGRPGHGSDWEDADLPGRGSRAAGAAAWCARLRGGQLWRRADCDFLWISDEFTFHYWLRLANGSSRAID